MDHLDWNRLKIFHAVAEAGSFTEAGRRLRLSQSAVSRQISALEESLHNVPLFHRHARGLSLTEQGEALFLTAQELVTKLSAAQGLIMEQREKPAGRLRISATTGFGSTWLCDRLALFTEKYPDIQVQLSLNDYAADLTRAEADVAIQMTPPNQPGLIQRHFVHLSLNPYASENYVKRFGMPKTPEDLDKHKLIVYGPVSPAPFPDANWLLAIGKEDQNVRTPHLLINSNTAMLRACAASAGIASLPDYMALGYPGVVRLLPQLEGPKVPTYFVYPEALRNSKRIHVFRDFLLEEAAKTKF